ncbi:MAG: NHL repeat-containing protein [Chloroflexi bacterium]|nr:NHL repeat-containing protein [Chloroflexota bacterium]
MKRLPLAPILTLVLLVFPAASAGAGSSGSDSATAVWGQPNFISSRCLTPSSITLCGPSQTAVDSEGNLWVVDFDDNRVLMYPPGSAIASKVFGQYGSFTSKGCNQRPPAGSHYPSAPNRHTLCQPFGVAIDPQGTLYIADSINNRVLVYFHAAHKPPAAPADLLLGQSTFSSTASNDVQAGGAGAYRCPSPRPASRCTLNSPMELSIDPDGDLLVPDVDNHRVLLWSASVLAHVKPAACSRRCFIPASRVWGQYGSFRTNTPNNPAIPAGASSRCTAITYETPASACTLRSPSAAIADVQGDLFVADTSNNRVLEYSQALSTGRQDATVVYGQSGNFRSAGGNVEGVSAISLWHPLGLAFGPDGHLWVSDFYNMRVLGYPAPGAAGSTSAVQVLGQRSSLETNHCAVFADTLCGPTSIAFDAQGHAFVSDGLNSRVLEFFAHGS